MDCIIVMREVSTKYRNMEFIFCMQFIALQDRMKGTACACVVIVLYVTSFHTLMDLKYIGINVFY